MTSTVFTDRVAEEEGLRVSVAALTTLATGRLGLEDLLLEVATFAVRAIPGADGAGLRLLEKDRADTVVSTAPFVRHVAEIQYGIGQGPGISAAAEQTTLRSGSLGGDSRWPRFGATVARLGVHSTVALPLVTADQVVGAIDVYAYAKHAFDDRSAELGGLFAVPAAVAVQNAQVLAETQRLALRLQLMVDAHRVVDRAVGILMSRTGDTEAEALDKLRAVSQREHRKLTVVAQLVLDEAVRRARARHPAG